MEITETEQEENLSSSVDVYDDWFENAATLKRAAKKFDGKFSEPNPHLDKNKAITKANTLSEEREFNKMKRALGHYMRTRENIYGNAHDAVLGDGTNGGSNPQLNENYTPYRRCLKCPDTRECLACPLGLHIA